MTVGAEREAFDVCIEIKKAARLGKDSKFSANEREGELCGFRSLQASRLAAHIRIAVEIPDAPEEAHVPETVAHNITLIATKEVIHVRSETLSLRRLVVPPH